MVRAPAAARGAGELGGAAARFLHKVAVAEGLEAVDDGLLLLVAELRGELAEEALGRLRLRLRVQPRAREQRP
eukprot:2007410-Rhodomonas_salina.1